MKDGSEAANDLHRCTNGPNIEMAIHKLCLLITAR